MLKTNTITQKFMKLGCDNAPGQESSQVATSLPLKGEKLSGTPVDFSHGDVDAFEPLPGAFEAFSEGFRTGGSQAYTEYKGKYTIRQDVAQKLSQFTGDAIDPDKNIILTPGTQGALFLAMGSLITSGDKVAIVEPDYFANRKLVEFFDGEIVPIQMDYYASDQRAGLNLNQLENAFKNGVKLFLFSNPNNPTGGIMSKEDLEAIAEVLRGTNIMVLSDEIYAELRYDGEKHIPFSNFEGMKERTVVVSGFSKTFAMTGWRLGYALGPERIIKLMTKIHQYGIMSAPTTAQFAAIEALKSCDDDVAEMRREYNYRRRYIVDGFRAMGLSCFEPLGAFYVFPCIKSTGMTSEEFCQNLLMEEKVAVVPGNAFGESGEGFIRCSYAYSIENIQEALKRIEKFVKRHSK